ncbi:hypothetical protein [Sphingobacterium sp. IITKGP-BTPF85]|uniref:hypothetical protein n=1 Tax=Sphingobacterium sp. IITKGP-BTPF85 TaxID=1338009 RepID=UPI00038A19A0|nr:hypothetical protein [Sphingobacterium sp. IITKGP-BTPF85]KKX49403.1 hypothetical protein L950_0215835 [Sphingobacterium sp. IITKGP-BTPF85]
MNQLKPKQTKQNIRGVRLLMYLVLLTICITTTSSSLKATLQKEISIEFNNVTIKQALHDLHGKMGVKFVYSPNDIDENKKIKLSFHNEKLEVF